MPDTSTVYVDQALTNAVVARPRQGFIAEQIFPVINVQKQTGKVFEYDPDDETFRVSDDARAPGNEANLVDFTVEAEITYNAKDHALASVVPDEEMANADAPIRPFLDRVEFLDNKIQLKKEVNLVAKLVAALTGGLTSSPSNKWNNYTDGDPIGDLKTKLNAIRLASGVSPNRIAMDELVLTAISEHPDFIDRAKHTVSPDAVAKMGNAKLLGALLTMSPDNPIEIVVSSSIAKNTAVKGQTASFSRIWDEYVLVYRFEPVRIGTAALGAHVRWISAAGGMQGRRVRRDRLERRHADWVEVSDFYDQIALKAAGAHLFTNTLT